MMDRIPPQNIEAEESILAVLLIETDPDRIGEILDSLAPEDFYKTAHQVVFKAVQAAFAKHGTTDVLFIKESLQQAGELEKAGGAAFLSDLMDSAPYAANPSHYATVIREKATRRRLITLCNDTARQCIEGPDFENILDRFQADALQIDGAAENTFHAMRPLVVEALERYQARGHGDFQQALLTGFHELDQLTGGFFGPKLILICARPGIGKTAFMLCLARNMALAGHKIGIFSIEMDAQELQDRLFAMQTGINTTHFSTGTGPEKDEWRPIQDGADVLGDLLITIDDTGGLSIGELRRRCRKMKKQGVEIIFIDQLSRITGGTGRSDFERKTDIVDQLATLKKELRIPVVLLAQVNRNVEGRSSKAPTLADLKSTGALEENADLVLLLHREGAFTRLPEDKNHAQLDLAKHRGGPTRIIKLFWEPKTTTFRDRGANNVL